MQVGGIISRQIVSACPRQNLPLSVKSDGAHDLKGQCGKKTQKLFRLLCRYSGPALGAPEYVRYLINPQNGNDAAFVADNVESGIGIR